MQNRIVKHENGELRKSAALMHKYICCSGKHLKKLVYLAIAQIGNKSFEEVFPPHTQKKSTSKYNILFYNDIVLLMKKLLLLHKVWQPGCKKMEKE